MSSFCIASLLSPDSKPSSVRSTSSQKSSPKPKLDINLPVVPMLSAADILQMANAGFMNTYTQPNISPLFNQTTLNGPAVYPFNQLPPFFVNGFPPNGYFGPNTSLFQSNGMILQQLSGRRKRRHRTIFTDEQLAILESNFSANAYPDIALREKLAIQCDLKEERVEVWFKNRRAKERKKRQDFPENATRGSTENGVVSPYFEHSSSSEHNKLSDESDVEDFKSNFPANLSSKLPSKLALKVPTSDLPPQNCIPNKRKRLHSNTAKEEELPATKRIRPDSTNKTTIKVD